MPGQKCPRRKAPPSLGLDDVDSQNGAVATSDAEAIAASLDDLTRSVRCIRTTRVGDLGAENQIPGAGEEAERVRPWMQASDEVVDGLRWSGPVDATVVSGQARGERRQRMVLRLLLRLSGSDLTNGRHQQGGTQLGQRALDDVARLVVRNGTDGASKHWTGVHFPNQPNHRNPGFALSGNDGAMDGSRTSIAGQQRCVYIDRSVTGRVEDRIWQKLAVGSHHSEVDAARG